MTKTLASRLVGCLVVILLLMEGTVYGQQIKQNHADTARVKQLYQKAEALANEGHLRSAGDFLKRGKRLSDSLDYTHGQEAFYVGKVNILLNQRKADSAEKVIREGLKRFPEGEESAQLYSLLGSAYSIKGKNEQALKAYAKAIARIDSAKHPVVLARAKFNIAGSYYDVGKKGEAFKYYHQTISIAEQAGDSTFLAVALNNIGNTYNYEEDYKKAAYYLKRAINVSKAVGFRINLLRATTNLGNTKKDSGNLDEALQYYKQAMQLSAEVRPNAPPMIILNNLGSVYLKKGDLNRAKKNFNKSLNYSRQAHINPGVYFNNKGLSKVAERRGNLEGAVTLANQAKAAAQKTGNPAWIEDAEKRLYLLYKRKNNYKQALAHLESLKTLSDSLQDQRYKQNLAESKSKLEMQRQKRINKLLKQQSEKQQKLLASQRWLIAAAIFIIILLGVIAFLEYRSQKTKQQSIKLLRQKQVQLVALNEEKNRLFAIVAHDIRNPMSAMQGMLYLLRDEDLNEDKKHEMLAQLEVSMLQNLHMMDNLLAWAQKQLSGLNISLSDIYLKPLVAEKLDDQHFEAQQKGIELCEHIPDDLRVHADRNLLEIIVRNLLGNAIKFCEAGDRIEITGRQKDGWVEVQVIDSGIGIPAGQQPDIFSDEVKSRTGTHNEKGNGLGLNLCKQFVEERGGKISFESREGHGTTFTFTLPAAG